MKKPTKKIFQHRKLVVRCEAITLLTPPQLSNVLGGGAETAESGWPPMCTTFGGFPGA